jgi:L-ornithine N5-oxygenase
MTHRNVELVAVGAGPSNLALAVALEELAPPELAGSSLLLEQNPEVAWQPGMLLPWTRSQVSFLKDLVTLRNPTSRFSFVNYLHATGRLDDFVNLGSFTPYRQEISGYLGWVAGQLQSVRIEFGRRVRTAAPKLDADGRVTGWLLTLADGSTVGCRYLVIGAGRDAHVPDVFAGLPREKVIHSTWYSAATERLDPAAPHRVAVIGGAQSAAEMLLATHQRFPRAQCTMVMRSVGLTAYGSSKFVNELYYPGFVDEFHAADPAARAQVLAQMHQTNYAGLAPDLLDGLYREIYLEKLAGRRRLHLNTMTDVLAARTDGEDIVLTLHDRLRDVRHELRCDVVMLGTGFVRDFPRLVRGLADSLGLEQPEVSRHYRLLTENNSHAGQYEPGAAYLQGVNEATHGIADSLLSVLGARAGDLTEDLLAHRRVHALPAAPRHAPEGDLLWTSAV